MNPIHPNLLKYNCYCEEFKKDGATEFEAAAIAKIVEESIINRDYILYYGNEEIVKSFDVIVCFDVDPQFGIYIQDDDNYIACSTSTGVTYSTL